MNIINQKLNMNKNVHYNIIIIGCGVSGLLAANNLLSNNYKGTIAIIDSKSKENIFEEADDVPYYFNSNVQISNLLLKKIIMNFQIWDNGNFYTKATDEIAEKYANKIVKQSCNTTIRHIKGEKDIFIPLNSTQYGRRNYLLRLLFEQLYDNINFFFESQIITIDIALKKIQTSNNAIISYDNLISTIDLPSFFILANRINKFSSFKHIPFYIAILNNRNPFEYRAVYISDENIRFNRFAFIGERLFIECPVKFDLSNITNKEKTCFHALDCLWILGKNETVKYKEMIPGRLVSLSIEDSVCLENDYNKYDIYFLGRFGTWTFKLTEDVWNDSIKITKKILNNGI